jgi:SAM-dependent methyltransferase
MGSQERLENWLKDARAPFEGWNFSYLDGRYSESAPPWSYAELARDAVRNAFDILDVDTGGGEVFASFAPYPGRATVVEAYAPNVPLARSRLAPLGVSVFEASPVSGLPFADASFDLALNRHGGIGASETWRILKPGGRFLTQQVGGDNLADLAAAFGAQQAHADNVLERVRADLVSLGFEIRHAEAWHGPVTFGDVGALVYYLKAIPWVVADFDVERHLDALHAMQARIDRGQALQFTASRFLIDAVKT